MRVNHSARPGGIIGVFFNMTVYCVFSLESPHRGDSYEYKQYKIFNIYKNQLKLSQNLQLSIIFNGTQKRVRHSKRAISVQATEVLL